MQPGPSRAYNTDGPARGGGGRPPPPRLTDGREPNERDSLSLSHFYILKSGYTLMNLEEALFSWGKAFSIYKNRGGMYLPGLYDIQVFTFISW